MKYTNDNNLIKHIRKVIGNSLNERKAIKIDFGKFEKTGYAYKLWSNRYNTSFLHIDIDIKQVIEKDGKEKVVGYGINKYIEKNNKLILIN